MSAYRKKCVWLFASDISSFIGQNKWDYATPFERVWKKCDPDGYTSALAEIENKKAGKLVEITQIQQQHTLLDDDLREKRITQRQYAIKMKQIEAKKRVLEEGIERLDERLDTVQLNQQQRIEKVIGADVLEAVKTADISTADKKTDLHKVLDKLDVPEEQRIKLKDEVDSFINKDHGTVKENDAIAQFEKRFNVKLDTSQQFNKYYLKNASKNSKFDWYICGKVDGLYMDPQDPNKNFIVEVKNRTKSFFTSLRDYEKTQIQLYMLMLGISNAKLVEHHNNKQRITHIHEDQNYIDEVIGSLNLFISNFEHKFLNQPKQKPMYLNMEKFEKREYLYHLYISDIEKYKSSLHETDFDEDECMIEDSE
jgi:hypothetical protein